MTERGERIYGEKSPIYSSIERIDGTIIQNDVALPFDGSLTIRTSYKNRMPVSSYPVIKIGAPRSETIRNTFHTNDGLCFDCDIIINKHGRCSAQIVCTDNTIQVLVNTSITKE